MVVDERDVKEKPFADARRHSRSTFSALDAGADRKQIDRLALEARSRRQDVGGWLTTFFTRARGNPYQWATCTYSQRP